MVHLLALMVSMAFFGDQPFKPTGIYARPVTVQVSTSPSKVRSRKKFITMFTADYCGACRVWKTRQKSRVTSRGIHVKEINMSKPAMQRRYGNRVSSLPSFVACDWETGAWDDNVVVGNVDADTVANLLNPSEYQTYEEPTTTTTYTPTVNRYISWPGWGTIDLETYNRNCNCSMCRSIRGMQQNYQAQKNNYVFAQQVVSATPPTTPIPPDQQPCPPEVVEYMLDLMQLDYNDTLVDLGCGDGRILIAAAKRGIRSIGVEIDPKQVELTTTRIQEAGLEHLASVNLGDAREFDTSQATAVTAYLYPTLLEELAPKLKAAKVAATPYHEVPGLTMTKHGDVWVHRS